MYYITKTEDNVEEVISVHPYDNEVKVMTFLNDKYGQMFYSRTKTGSLKATPVNNKEIFFTIVGDKKVKVDKDWRETEDVLTVKGALDYTSITLESNYEDWNLAKLYDYPLHIIITNEELQKFVSVGLALSDIIKLRDYLSQKIEFLSE